MSSDMLFVLQWYGAIAAAIAALVVALDLGRRPTGWAFVLFFINLFGISRYLIRKREPGAPA